MDISVSLRDTTVSGILILCLVVEDKEYLRSIEAKTHVM